MEIDSDIRAAKCKEVITEFRQLLHSLHLWVTRGTGAPVLQLTKAESRYEMKQLKTDIRELKQACSHTPRVLDMEIS